MESRYSRQILFSGIGVSGQQRLKKAVVTVVGCGALGSVSSEILARAGIGHLRIIDRDYVEWTNLQRQSLFTEEDAKGCTPKAVAAEKVLRAINSEIEVKGVVADVTHLNVSELCSDSDVVVDGSDNFEVRFLVNDFACKNGIPWLYGAALGSYGVSFAIIPGTTPCLRCLFQELPASGTVETCETAGILAPVIHIVSAFQASQVLKLLVGERPSDGVLQIDIWDDTIRSVGLKEPLASCECCQRRYFRFLEGREKTLMTQLCGRNAVQLSPQKTAPVDLDRIAKRLKTTMEVRSNEFLLKAVTGDIEIALFSDGRAIIKGTDDYAEARAIYSKYIGN
jgi:adenylyltransferase/sulfurtransferase